MREILENFHGTPFSGRATDRGSNIVLVGMPGSGKSTIGVILAKTLCCGFIDTDILIQDQAGRSLQAVVDSDGPLALRGIEEDVILKMDVCNHVIATGGSAIYSVAAMKHLRTTGIVVFLDVDLNVIIERIADFSNRGIAMNRGQTFPGLFEERVPLYRAYADIVVECSRLSHDETRDAVARAILACPPGPTYNEPPPDPA
jgi:shikimate kinase